MPLLEMSAVFLACILIGGVAAILGLGGGIFIVPFLAVVLDIDIRIAAGTALICTLATSAAGSVALDKARLAHLPLVCNLELAAVCGAFGGAFLAAHLAPKVVAGIFALLVGYAAVRMFTRARRAPPEYKGPEPANFKVVRYPLGLLGFAVAGTASGLLGIGGGPIKVPVQTEIMKVPLRVALANSNLMVGITAGAGVTVYYADGVLLPALAAPCALGTALGAYLGGLLAPRLNVRRLTYAFSAVLALVALRMLWKAIELAA